jgi:hypothetical protein
MDVVIGFGVYAYQGIKPAAINGALDARQPEPKRRWELFCQLQEMGTAAATALNEARRGR